jgi:hypothetical protein
MTSGGEGQGPAGRTRLAPLLLSGCSGVWHPPPEYRNKEACNQGNCLETHLYPVPDRRGISMSNPIRPVQKPVQKISTEIRDFSLGKAMPQVSAAIDAQNRWRRCARRLHEERTAFKHPCIEWRHATTNLPLVSVQLASISLRLVRLSGVPGRLGHKGFRIVGGKSRRHVELAGLQVISTAPAAYDAGLHGLSALDVGISR